MCKYMDTIYVAFRDSDRWHKHFLRKGFAHCSIILPVLTDEWLEIDPTRGVLQFNLRTHGQLSTYTKILRVKINKFNFKGFPLKFFTCVKIVEYILGKNIHAITPYRLYKKLTGSLRKTFNTEEII